jgi:hypothetical protein
MHLNSMIPVGISAIEVLSVELLALIMWL